MMTFKSFKALVLNTLSVACLFLLPFALLFVAVNDNFGCKLASPAQSEFVQSMSAGFAATYGNNISSYEMGNGIVGVKFGDKSVEEVEMFFWKCKWSSGQHFVQIAFNCELPQDVLDVLVSVVADRKDQLSGEEPYVAVLPEMSVRGADGIIVKWHDGPVTVLSLEFQDIPLEDEAYDALNHALLQLARSGMATSFKLLAP